MNLFHKLAFLPNFPKPPKSYTPAHSFDSAFPSPSNVHPSNEIYLFQLVATFVQKKQLSGLLSPHTAHSG